MRWCFLQGCLLAMAVSFPNIISSAIQCSDAASRLDSAFSARSHAVSMGDECGAWPIEKSRKSTEENFEAVLAWMTSGAGPQQNAAAVNVEDTTPTSVSLGTDLSGKTNSFRVERSTVQAGTAMLPTIATVPGSALPQDVVEMPEAVGSAALDEAGFSNQTTPRVTVNDGSLSDGAMLNSGATSIQSQSVHGIPNQQSTDGSVSSVIEQVPSRQSVSTVSVVRDSDPFESQEPLSQDTIAALERIGRSSELTILGTSASSILTAPADAYSTSAQPVLTPPVVSLSASRFPEIKLPKSDSRVSKLSISTSSVTTSAGLNASETGLVSIETTSPEGLTSSSGTVLPLSGFSVGFESVESIVKSGTWRVSSDSHASVSDRSGFPSSVKSRSAAVMSSDAVRNDVVQPGVTNALPDLAVAITSEIRQPLSNQVSQTIMEHIERNGIRQNDSLTVRLDPPELGEMTIELSKTHEGLAVRVTAREAVTMDMLFARGHEIESHLRGQQMNLKSLEFLRADMSGNQFSQGQQQNDASHSSENLMTQFRRGSRSSSPAIANVGRIATPDSVYGLSFRA